VDPDTRSAIWSDAIAAFREKLTRFAEMVARPSWEIADRHAVASLLRDVRDDALFHHERRYGTRAYRQLVRFFGLHEPTAEALIRFADVYTLDQAKELGRQVMRDGNALSIFHLERLAGVLDPQAREALLERTLADSLTLQNLSRLVEEANRAGGSRAGRPFANPGSLDALITQQEVAANEFLNRSDRVWKRAGQSLSAMGKALKPDQITQQIADRLSAHAQRLDLLASEARQYAEEARGLSQRLQASIGGGGAPDG
jgi:hypothetical protein